MKVENYLVLNKYFLSLFGAEDFGQLQEKLRDAPPGTDTDGRTHFVNVLRSSLSEIKIPEDTLLKYDSNIQLYVNRINESRRERVTLKYFQYLAVLFSEIFLDNINTKDKRVEFLDKINTFLRKDEEAKEIVTEFTENDLKKIAFWMATGSGKTLIAHINYYQFFNYALFEPDNIIFITPNAGLSKQHFEELQKSGIPARIYSGSLNGGLRADKEVLVIEITKFVEEKKGEGLTLPVDVFEGKNLVFVDEAHKGKKSEEQKWAKLRDELAKEGFVFEYSATFGQILSENKKSKNEKGENGKAEKTIDKDILKEYSKAILFNYSYKYFYLDGYGKDFWVLNLQTRQDKDKDAEFQETVFVANLLDFYEQMVLYKQKYSLAKQHQIEKPLWIFVGATVTGKEEESDVLQIVEFIRKTLSDGVWLEEKIRSIISGNFKDSEGNDLFSNKFKTVRQLTNGQSDISILITDLYKAVFNGRGSLEVYEIKNAEGEFGLKVGENPYFGVINIGNVSEFKKSLTQNNITVKEDAISSSLFDDIKKENSTINLLIGSRKFMEGWDTWRVSSMGLLNIGRGQGPQIIQLFGRGVRLKGKDLSLKRSDNEEIRPLETLNIYGIKADYLDKFLSAIEKEEVDLEAIKIPVKVTEKEKWQSLPYLKKDESKKFEAEKIVKLTPDETINFILDLTPRLSAYLVERKEKGRGVEQIKGTTEIGEKTIYEITDIELLNWQRILNEMLEFKLMRGYWNLFFDLATLRQVLAQCKVRDLPERLTVRSYMDLQRIEDIALDLLKGYMDKFYKKHKGKFETDNIKCVTAGEALSSFASEMTEYYTVYIKKNQRQLIDAIKELCKDLEKLATSDENGDLPRVDIENSVYRPILLKSNLKSKEIDKISPPGLVESEKKFVEGLREYLGNNAGRLQGYHIILLRNEARSGIGFQLDWAGFYPDFIMWIKGDEKTRMVFIDPKGLHHTKGLDDEKVEFINKGIKEIETNLNQEILLYAFILSDTKYGNLKKGTAKDKIPSKEDYEKKNVLFLEDNNWCGKLFEKVLPSTVSPRENRDDSNETVHL